MKTKSIYQIAEERILLLDGALGTMIQRCGLTPEDFRGQRFASHSHSLDGCNDILVLTRPDVIAGIHRQYLEAGADIISTDSFNANAISLAEYGLSPLAREIAREAARTARAEADRFTAADPSKPRFVAGSVGPTNKTSSLLCDPDNPDKREVSFQELADAYAEQIAGLAEGGADIILIETVFDTLNAKAALFAAAEHDLPVMLSGTPADAAGRMLSGQTVEAFYTSVSHAPLFSIGFNCAFGAEKLMPFLQRLADIAEFRVSAHPNAGLPDIDGNYVQTPRQFVAEVEKYMQQGLVNIIGGCCGTTPEHIRLLAAAVGNHAPRPLPQKSNTMRLSGLEELRITPEINFVNIGERTNVAGSARFARMIREGDFENAVAVARAQVGAGAQIIDVCMDDGMTDGPAVMSRFLRMAGADTETARVPVMIDSSSWNTIEAGLQVVQGKCIVNSLSLKEGPQALLEKARKVRAYGAALVVMLFDEKGQADTYERKIEVARRAYDLLTGDGFPPQDIVFDPNILTVATGIPEHNEYARAFIEAARWIKCNLPHARVSGGVSNLSFAFRGNNTVREAMHAVFLHHAVAAGMDMGIVNPQMLVPYELIEPELALRAEDLILNRRPDAAERLADYAQRLSASPLATQSAEVQEQGTVAERIARAMQRGAVENMDSLVSEAVAQVENPAQVIDTMLMPAMEHIGVLFGQGKMFLPQVIKSAAVMKRAIASLMPAMSAEGKGTAAGKIVLATVKGDVHDIGKNIVATIAACNGFAVTDLGVSVATERIVDEAVAAKADAVCLSGLITPSLDEMKRVCEEAGRRGLRIPIIVGGAATSPLHTAMRLAPAYSGIVVNARDAGDNCRLLTRLCGPARNREENDIRMRQQALRDGFGAGEQSKPLPLGLCRSRKRVKTAAQVAVPRTTGVISFGDIPVGEVIPYIDWNFFFASWEVKGRYPEILGSPDKGAEARRLYADATAMLERIRSEKRLTLQAVAGIFPACSDGDDIAVDVQGREYRLPMLRCQTPGQQPLSLADYLVPCGQGTTDYVGCFALTAGAGLKEWCRQMREEGDEYGAVMAKLLADRLAEALAEWLHRRIRREFWGYEAGQDLDIRQILDERYKGRRMAFGYPATPDHSLKREVFDMLGVGRLTQMTLTENCMIEPGESLCGLLLSDAEYFTVGIIGRDQLEDYARRRGVDVQTVKKLLPHNTTE